MRYWAMGQRGEPLATIYATRPEMLAEPAAILKRAITISEIPPDAVKLVSRIFTRETAQAFLESTSRTS